MGISVCPAAVVAAPVEDVWELLSQPSRYDEWWDAHTERIVPEGPAVAGQWVHAWTTALGKRVDVSFVIERVDPGKHEIQFKVTLPFGIAEDTTIKCTPVDATTSRVQYG